MAIRPARTKFRRVNKAIGLLDCGSGYALMVRLAKRLFSREMRSLFGSEALREGAAKGQYLVSF